MSETPTESGTPTLPPTSTPSKIEQIKAKSVILWKKIVEVSKAIAIALWEVVKEIAKFFVGLFGLAKNFLFDRPARARSISASRYLQRLSILWGILSIIGALVVSLQTECSDRSVYGTCYETSHPYVNWAITGLLANLIVMSFFYTVATYIESRMSETN